MIDVKGSYNFRKNHNLMYFICLPFKSGFQEEQILLLIYNVDFSAASILKIQQCDGYVHLSYKQNTVVTK